MNSELKDAQQELMKLETRRDKWIAEMGANQGFIKNRLGKIDRAYQEADRVKETEEAKITERLKEHNQDFRQYQLNLERIRHQRLQVQYLESLED